MDLALAFEDAQPVKLTVDQFRELMAQGIVEESPRIELFQGMIVSMNAQATLHSIVAFELGGRLRDRLREIGSTLMAVTTPSVDLPPENALDPDVAVTVPPARGAALFPVAGIRLLIEVSNTSLKKDLGPKRDIYAAAGIPEYWVVDVNKAVVHRFSRPANGVYVAEPPVPLAGELCSLTLSELAIDGTGIL